MGKPMKTMKKAMKAVSVIARGRGAYSRVFRGLKSKTGGGLTRDGLVRNKYGRIVSKKRQAAARKNAAKSGFSAWGKAVGKARKELGLKGFVAIGGKSASGKASQSGEVAKCSLFDL